MARIQTFPKSRLKLDDKLILFSDVVKEYLPIGLELYDRNGLLIDANKAEMEIMGVVDLNEALGISLFENPNFSDKIIDDIKAGQDVHFSLEYDFDKVKTTDYFKTVKKGIDHIDGTISIIRNKQKEIIGYLVISQDYGAIQFKYENLYNQMLTIMNSLPVGIELYDNDGTISFLNDTDAAIFGISDIEGAIRKKPSIYDNPNVPDCVKNAVYSKKPISLRFPYNFKTIAQTKYYSTNKNNDDVWVECNGKPIIDPNGRIGSYTFVMEDVTEKTRAEEELKESNQKAELILNNINSGLAYITPDYVVQWENMVKCSTAFPNGAYRQGELCYKSTYNRRSPCENCVIQRAAVSHRVEQMRIFLEENRMVELFATPVFRNTGEIDGFVIRIDDITDKERMIKELKHAEESDRLKSVFLANMSHEIRTPLNAIVGFSNLLVETNDPDEKEEYTRIINNNNELLLKLISDILDLSKIESGSVKLKYEDFDLSGYFDELAVSMKQRITNPDVNLVIVNRYDKCLVCLDKNRVAQILTNYMINAIKYTVKGTIEMGYDATKSGIYFYVKDSGIGILDEKKNRVFHRFEKLDEFAQGTGLGLSICKAIAEAMGGKVGFESTYGKGSLFWASLPCETKSEVS